jgi:carboxypeptidase Q
MHAGRRGLFWSLLLGFCCWPQAAEDPRARIRSLALADGRAHATLAQLTDRIGPRLSGTSALERAVTWAAAQFSAAGIEQVWTEKVLVPHWVRGPESGRIVEPVAARLALLGLGGGVATPPEGLTAEVLEVDGFDRLEAHAAAVRGKIVLFNKVLRASFDGEDGYSSVVKLRSDGPARAARLGALAVLVRAVGTADFRLPHTGALRYVDGVPKIPAAAISAEDAELLHRLLAAGDTVRVHLELGAEQRPDAESANVLAELPGHELPAEIVLIGAHLDSWDVGQGAVDDGAGCAIVIETLRVLKALGTPPRRTIRAVLFTNEENGLRGGSNYAERHGNERHVAAIESDSGGARPLGFGVTAGEGGVEQVVEIAHSLAAIGADAVLSRGGGADISPLRKRGVPVLSLNQDPAHYFDYHHTEADTLDKVDAADLDKNVAALATMAWALAQADHVLPAPPPEPEPEK